MAEAFDASDPKQVQDAKSSAGRRRKADNDVVAKLMESGDGRSWIWRFLTRCHIFEPSMSDPEATHATAFREGERNIGLSVLQDIMRAAPDSYILMSKENNDGT